MAVGRELAHVVPLVDRGSLIGRLSVWNPNDARPLAQTALLAAVERRSADVANHLAVALDRLRLAAAVHQPIAINDGESLAEAPERPDDPLVALIRDLEAALAGGV